VKRQTGTDQNVLPFVAPAREDESSTVLTVVEPLDTPPVLDAQLGVQTSRVVEFGRPKGKKLGAQTQKLGVQKLHTGRPAGGDNLDEMNYPSRIKRKRVNLRPDSQLLKIVKQECRTVDPPLKLQDVTEDAWRLWLQARAQAKLDVQTPTGSSCSSSGLNQTDLTTTTTTTLGVQAPKSPPLPAFAAEVLELQPHKSKHSLEVNLAYAWETHRNDRGIKSPDAWAISNYRTGRYDKLVDLWIARKEQEAKPEPSVGDAWSRVMELLSQRLDREAFEKWFVPIECEGIEHHVIRLRAPNQTVKDRVTTGYGRVVIEALTELKLSGFTVSWTIAESGD